ncbi:MAG: universal stress protein [Planctomycetota bacterium]
MRVLFASDGSSDATKAAQFIATLAINNPVDLHVLTVSCAPERLGPHSPSSFFSAWDEAEKKYVAELQSRLKDMFQPICDSLVMSRTIGPVSQSILDESVGMEADVIVMGARGHSLVHRMLLGSISDHVASKAKCSVAVIRDRANTVDTLPSPTKLLAAFDRSKGSREAIAEVMKLQWGKEVGLNVLSIAPLPLPFENEGFAPTAISWEPTYLDNIREEAERVASQVAEKIPKCDVEIRRSNHPGDAIVGAAEESQTDLIFMGDTGHTLLDEWLLGSTSKYVLRHAPCSVWISRHHRRSIQSIEDIRERETNEMGTSTV